MIHNFANKLARDIWEKESSRRFPQGLVGRAKAVLTLMHSSTKVENLLVEGQPPDLCLHKLKGKMSGRWSMTIAGPWRITFRFERGMFFDVKIEDYH